MGDWVYWVSWSLSIVIIVTMVYLAWRALFHDRPNGRRRCPKCWYDLSYAPAPGMTCSECGYTARREKQLMRTRRRYATALLAMLTVAAVVALAKERMGRFGWSSTMPTQVLILALPVVEPRSMFYQELVGRAEKNVLTDRQWASLMRRCAKGDATATPTDDVWLRKYGSLISHTRRVLAGNVEEETIASYHAGELPLLALPPLLRMSSGIRPQDGTETVWTVLSLAEWWPHRSEVRLELTPVVMGGVAESVGVRYAAGGRRDNSIAVPLGAVPPGIDELRVAVDAYHRRDRHGAWNHAGQTVHTLRLPGANDFAALPEAVADERVDRLLQRIFRGDIVRWAHGHTPVRFAYQPDRSITPTLNGVAIGAALELRHDDRVARRIEIWWLAGSDRSLAQRATPVDDPVYWRIDFEDPALLATLSAEDPRWRMVISGEAAIAARVAGAQGYWAGTFDLPITILERSGAAPPPAAWLE